MIKLPKEINKLIRDLYKNGFTAYPVGRCVRESIMGLQPIDWDVVTDAGPGDLQKLFPEAEVIDEDCGTIRLEFPESSPGADDGIIADVSLMCTGAKTSLPKQRTGAKNELKIEDDLAIRDFTVDAIADVMGGDAVDPFDGRKDIKERLIRTVRDPGVKFDADPGCMITAIRLAAELGFDLHKSVYEAIVASADKLQQVDTSFIREELTQLIDSDNAGKGLRMLAGTGLMPYIIGEKCALHMRFNEKRAFNELCENIDRIKHVPERRLGLLYLCFDGKKGVEAIDMLDYDAKTREHFIDARELIPVITFFRNKIALKDFVNDYGLERYEYIHNLVKAQRIVHDLAGETKIQSRNYMWNEVKMNGEPVFEEDLPITREEILKAGICGEELIDEVMKALVDDSHRAKVSENTRDILMKKAAKYAKSKLKRKNVRVNWSR